MKRNSNITNSSQMCRPLEAQTWIQVLNCLLNDSRIMKWQNPWKLTWCQWLKRVMVLRKRLDCLKSHLLYPKSLLQIEQGKKGRRSSILLRIMEWHETIWPILVNSWAGSNLNWRSLLWSDKALLKRVDSCLERQFDYRSNRRRTSRKLMRTLLPN